MFWSRKDNKQAVCLLSETNSAEDKDLDADLLHASSPETAEGWLLESRQMVRDEITGRYIQFVSSKYGCPIRIYKTTENDNESSPNIEDISSQTEDQEMVFTTDEKTKSSMLLWVGIVTALLTLTVLVIALIVVV